MFLINVHSMSGPFLSKAGGDETPADVEEEAGEKTTRYPSYMIKVS